MKNISEVFDDFEKANDENERINVLRRNDSKSLRGVLRGTYDPDVEFTISKVPLYKPSDAPEGLGYTTISQELDRAYLFQKNNPRVSATLSESRKETILIQMLEALEKREAEIFMNMLLKKQVVKGLNAKLVKKAFPDLF